MIHHHPPPQQHTQLLCMRPLWSPSPSQCPAFTYSTKHNVCLLDQVLVNLPLPTLNTVGRACRRQKSFATDEDLHGQNVLHVSNCPATCLLKNQMLPLWYKLSYGLQEVCVGVSKHMQHGMQCTVSFSSGVEWFWDDAADSCAVLRRHTRVS